MANNEQEQLPARQSTLAIALLAGGILLFVLSFFWPGQSASRAAWSPEQAKAYDAASIKLHSLSQQTVAAAGSNNEKALRAKIEQAKSEYKVLRSQLDSAIDRPKHITLALRIFGSLLTIAGLALIYGRANV